MKQPSSSPHRPSKEASFQPGALARWFLYGVITLAVVMVIGAVQRELAAMPASKTTVTDMPSASQILFTGGTTDPLTQAQQLVSHHQRSEALALLEHISPASSEYAQAEILERQISQGPVPSVQPVAAQATHSAQLFPVPDRLRVPILMYHYISVPPVATDKIRVGLSVTPAVFVQQMGYIATHGFHTVSLAQLSLALHGQAQLPPNSIVLTFDDGYRDFFENAYPVLEQYHLQATIFIITGKVGQPAYMTWPMIEQLDQTGFIEVGSHTVNHVDLADTHGDELQHELIDSKQALELHVHHPITAFCYPSGEYDAEVESAVTRAGYTIATTTRPGSWHTPGDILTLSRVRIENEPISELEL